MVVASLLGTPDRAAAAGGTDPQTASTITSLPFGDGGVGDTVPYPKATGTANGKVATECNSGQPLYAPRWFAYTASTTRSVVAQGAFDYEGPTRMRSFVPDGIAVLSADLSVIDCNVRQPERPATAGPVRVPTGTKVFIVHFSREAFCEPGACVYDTPARGVGVFDAAAYPQGDDWRTAVPITSVNKPSAGDTRLATVGDGDADCTIYYKAREPSLWWTFTPTGAVGTQYPLRLSAESLGLQLAELTPNGPQFVPTPGSEQYAGCDNAEGKTVKAGHTYLLFANGGGVRSASIISPNVGIPDLVVTSVVAMPASPKVGDPVAFRVTIKNQGTAPTPGGVIHGAGVQVDGIQQVWADTFTNSLAPGGSVTLSTNSGKAGVPTWPATAGTHVIKAFVDDVNRITEANETNNTQSVNLTVAAAPARPDLVVTSVTTTPANPGTGAAVRFSATVKNQGGAATPANVTQGVLFTVDGVTKTWSRASKASIAAGASVTLTADGGPAGTSTWTSTAGPHTLGATVDDQSLIAESNETNNQREAQVNVGAISSRPDLVVTSLSWTPTSPGRGAPIRFTAIVKNVGTRSTPAGTVIGVSFRPNGSTTGATYSDTRRSPLPPGGTAVLVANGGGTGGQWTPPAPSSTPIVAIVDDVGRVTELNEFNNRLTSTLTVN
jgi:hypothetical protein